MCMQVQCKKIYVVESSHLEWTLLRSWQGWVYSTWRWPVWGSSSSPEKYWTGPWFPLLEMLWSYRSSLVSWKKGRYEVVEKVSMFSCSVASVDLVAKDIGCAELLSGHNFCVILRLDPFFYYHNSTTHFRKAANRKHVLCLDYQMNKESFMLVLWLLALALAKAPLLWWRQNKTACCIK